ncbi:ribonuclease H-like domain-containing protein [Tanacetum coccineum]
MWRLRIGQYFQVQDYALWDVIKNGNPFKPTAKTTTNADGTSTTLIPGPVITEENVQKNNDMKARSKIVSQLAILGENISQEDLNLKFLRSLPSEWNTHVVVWRNKSDLDTMSFDDLYNNFKIVEQEVKGTARSSSSSSSSSQNMAFVSSSGNTNEVNTAYGKTRRKITINGSDKTGYDKSKVECFNCHKLGHFTRECKEPRNQDSRNRNQDSSRRTINVEETSSKAMLAIYGAVYGPKTSKNIGEDTSNEVRESPNAPMVEKLVSDDKLEKKIVFPTVAKIEFVRAKQQEKPVRKPVKYAEMYRSQGPRGNQRNWNNQKSQQLGSDFVMYNKACFVCGSFDHVQANCNYHQRERVVSGNNYSRVNYNYSAKKAHPSAHRNIVPRAVLMKTGLRPLNTARPVNTAHPKTTVYSARPMSCFSKSAQSTVKRPYQTRTTLTNKNFSQKVNTAKGNFYTARPKAVNTARPNSAVVNAVRENQVNAIKASACWVWRPTKLDSASIILKKHNYVDARGRSKHMTGNMSYLLDFKEFDRGYVHFVKELQFNLFSVSQMCDKKNSVLFTDTTCFILSPDFKLPDESQVLLKVPRKNNMYSVDMKNIVPKESLTCLVAKATLDESML